MRALLDDDVCRTTLDQPSRGLHEIRLLGELAGLAVVERDQIDMAEELEEVGTPALDPEVHGVASDELRTGALLEHVELEARIDVGEKHEGRIPECLGNLRSEVREHSEPSFERLRRVQVVPVPPAPAER